VFSQINGNDVLSEKVIYSKFIISLNKNLITNHLRHPLRRANHVNLCRLGHYYSYYSLCLCTEQADLIKQKEIETEQWKDTVKDRGEYNELINDIL
jgi:hypothetical protein